MNRETRALILDADSHDDPSISVVIPTHNRARMVARAVESVIAAVRSDDEIIVVDDGSTDDTPELLKPYQSRVKLVRTAHLGAGAARNAGIRTAQHAWVAFLDSDDTWDADKLQLQRPLLKYAVDVAFLFTDFRVQMTDGTLRSRYIRRWSNDPRSWEEILGPSCNYSELEALPPGRSDFKVYKADLYQDLMGRSYLAAFTYLFRKDSGEPMPSFAEDLPTYEDWQFFAQVALKGKGLYLDCETATQYAHSGPRLTDASELDAIRSRLKIMQRVWAADAAFMQTHRDAYLEVHGKLERRSEFLRGRRLALAGKLEDARSVFAGAGKIPWKYRLLFRFPDSIVRSVIRFANGLARVSLLRVSAR